MLVSSLLRLDLYASSQEEAQQYKEDFHKAFYDYLPVIKPGNKTAILSRREHVDDLQYISGAIIWNVSLDK